MLAAAITVTLLVPMMVRCQPSPESIDLIKRLDEFFHFDHRIFFVESEIDPNGWFPLSPSTLPTELVNFTPQTVYTFNGNTERSTMVKAKISKNQFLIVVSNPWKLESESQLLAEVISLRTQDINVKIGWFFAQTIHSLDIVEQLFRWSWRTGIVDIFCAFLLNDVGDDEPLSSSFNVFKYNPFGALDLITVTSTDSLLYYFPGKVPNHHKNSFVGLYPYYQITHITKFWNAVAAVFNASRSKTAENDYVEGFSQGDFRGFLYPHRQSMTVMIVPHAQPYADLSAYLQNGTWTLLFVFGVIVLVTSSLLLFASRYMQPKTILLFQCVVDVVNLLMNDNLDIKYQSLRRADVFVIVPLTFTGMIVMNGIVSLFQSYLMSPIYRPQINSLRDLYASSILILTNEYVPADYTVKLLEDPTNFSGWSDRIYALRPEHLYKEILSFNNSIAFFTDIGDVPVYLEVQKRLDLEAYHVLSDTFLGRHLLSYMVGSAFPFMEQVNDIIHRLNGAGLIERWVSQDQERFVNGLWRARRSNSQKDNETNATVDKFAVPSVVWCSWVASLIVFICGIIWNKIRG